VIAVVGKQHGKHFARVLHTIPSVLVLRAAHGAITLYAGEMR